MEGTVTNEDAAYLAGLFDGDGSVCILHFWRSHDKTKPRTHELYVNIANTNHEVMEWVKARIGVGTVHKKRCAGYAGARKDIWYWEARCRSAETFLRIVQPFVRIKRAHIEEALIFRIKQREIGNDVRDQCLTLKRLNSRPELCLIAA